MIKAVVIEDEAVAARRMQRLLEARKVEVIATIVSNSQFEEFLNSGEQPDLYFMDIHLSDGVVFDLLAKSQIETPIIFTTAYDQYAIKAFKQNSIDYLLKPIDEQELDAAIAKYNKSKTPIDYQILRSLLGTPEEKVSYKSRFSVKVGDKLRSIDVEDIQFFYSSEKVNYLYTSAQRSYPIDYSIEEVYKLLDPNSFYRVSRGHIVAIASIDEVIAYSNSRLKVKVKNANEHEIIVARDRVKAFKEWLG